MADKEYKLRFLEKGSDSKKFSTRFSCLARDSKQMPPEVRRYANRSITNRYSSTALWEELDECRY